MQPNPGFPGPSSGIRAIVAAGGVVLYNRVLESTRSARRALQAVAQQFPRLAEGGAGVASTIRALRSRAAVSRRAARLVPGQTGDQAIPRKLHTLNRSIMRPYQYVVSVKYSVTRGRDRATSGTTMYLDSATPLGREALSDRIQENLRMARAEGTDRLRRGFRHQLESFVVVASYRRS